jgi:hypothetical protein
MERSGQPGGSSGVPAEGRCYRRPVSDDVPSFFFPGTSSSKEAERYREAVVRFARDNGYPAGPRRIFRLRHRVGDVERVDEVGQIESQDSREVVVAILASGKLYLVVTSSRGFMRGRPIPYHRDEVLEVTSFRP